jgi:bacterioferritin-associated ferredoxin
MKKKDFSGIVCTCNMVPRTVIEKAIGRGCHRMEQIFTATTAGVGQCGGSCRPEIQKMLTEYLSTGKFPLPSPKVSKTK